MRTIDHLIIGQGLAGSALAWELRQRGKTVVVLDEPESNRSSAIAAGLFNPITGRVMTRTWLADQLFPVLHDFYTRASKELSQNFFHPAALYRPFVSGSEQQQWKLKCREDDLRPFISILHEVPQWTHQVKNPWGGIELAQCGFVDTNLWMSAVRNWLIHSGAYHQEFHEEAALEPGQLIRYRDIVSNSVIYCNGLGALNGKWFNWIPLKPLKGQTLRIKTRESLERIYSRGVFMVPVNSHEYAVGATYEHPPFDYGITDTARLHLIGKLEQLLQLPFDVVHQDWGIRPTTPDRKPIIGQHPHHKNIWLFNGLGTKGVSLAPYFARQLADQLDGRSEVMSEVNISRFYTLYSGSR